MLESFKDKYVKVLVSSNSGAGISGASRVYSSMLTVFGTIQDFDNQFIKLSNCTSFYFSGVDISRDALDITGVNTVKQQPAFENKEVLLNVNSIIEIAVVE